MLAFSLASALIIVAICLGINKNFFNIDDAVNEYLPFFTQMGRIWSSGKFPLLTDNTFLGSNVLVELSHCVFTPQSILASLLAWHCEYKQVAAIFLSFFNMTLMGLSCLVIGNLYLLRPAYSCLFSAFCTIQPVFLLIYCRSGYNAANAQAWFLAGVATFLLLAQRATVKNFLLNFFAVLFLFSANWAFAILAYGLFALIFLLFHIKKPVSFPSLAILLLANILALLCILPLYSEYVFNADLHDRVFAFRNGGNYLVPPWSSEVLTFLPTYFDFMKWFGGGYVFMVIPLAFSTIFVPIVIFNRKFVRFFQGDPEARFLICVLLAYFFCTQLPSCMGSTIGPFRYLPFFAFALCLATSYFLEYAERRDPNFLHYITFVILCCLLAASKSMGQHKIYIYLQLLSLILFSAIYIVDIKKYKNYFIYPLFAVPVLLILLADIRFTKQSMLVTPPLIRKIEFPLDLNHDGYIFTLAGNPSSKPYTTLYFQRSGLYTLKTINGYTPLGYKNWYTFLPGSWHQHQPEAALDALLVPLEGTDMCRANAWRISTFVLPADAAQKNRERLERCGYRIGADTSAAPMAYASLPFEETAGWEKLPPASFPRLEGMVHEIHEDAYDRLSLPARDEAVQLVFPRMYWHGFRAAFNGERLDVTRDESDFLTSVTVPAGQAGTVEFWFFPETWRSMWVCPALALIGLLGVGIYAGRRRPKGIWTPEPPRRQQ